MPRIVAISDIHPGRFESGREEAEKALQRYARLAHETGAELHIIGDGTEYLVSLLGGVKQRIYEEERKIVGEAFNLFCRHSGKPVIFHRGNHDHPEMDAAMADQLFAPSIASHLHFETPKWDPRQEKFKQILVANCGDFVGDRSPKTAVYADTEKQMIELIGCERGKLFTVDGPLPYGSAI